MCVYVILTQYMYTHIYVHMCCISYTMNGTLLFKVKLSLNRGTCKKKVRLLIGYVSQSFGKNSGKLKLGPLNYDKK